MRTLSCLNMPENVNAVPTDSRSADVRRVQFMQSIRKNRIFTVMVFAVLVAEMLSIMVSMLLFRDQIKAMFDQHFGAQLGDMFRAKDVRLGSF